MSSRSKGAMAPALWEGVISRLQQVSSASAGVAQLQAILAEVETSQQQLASAGPSRVPQTQWQPLIKAKVGAGVLHAACALHGCYRLLI